MTHVTITMLKAFQINEKGKPPSPPHNRDRVNNTKVSTFDSITPNVLQEHSFQIEFYEVRIVFWSAFYQRLLPKQELPRGIFPSDNFPNMQYPKRQLPKSVLTAALGSHCSLWRLGRPKLNFGKLTLGKLPFGKLSLGKLLLGKYLNTY